MFTKYFKLLLINIVLLLILTGCTQSQPSTQVHSLNADEIISQTNEYRVSQGLNTLEKDKILCEVAEIRAKEIVTAWSHTRPDGSKFYNILEDMNYTMDAAGENLGRYHISVNEVMDMWKSSDSHNKNMLGNYTKMGAAIYEEDGKFYFVQIFAR